jgi:hypothetical protein
MAANAFQIPVKRTATGNATLVDSIIESVDWTGDGKSSVWNVHVNEGFRPRTLSESLEYARVLTFPDREILVQRGAATGDAFLQEVAGPVCSGISFYTKIPELLDLHEELLPGVQAVTAEHSARLTEAFLRTKLVKLLK